jgi:hypothetical protein
VLAPVGAILGIVLVFGAMVLTEDVVGAAVSKIGPRLAAALVGVLCVGLSGAVAWRVARRGFTPGTSRRDRVITTVALVIIAAIGVVALWAALGTSLDDRPF